MARLVVACHYPVAVPPEYQREFARKPLVNATDRASWLATIGPHLYCCGHVHAAWAYQPDESRPALPERRRALAARQDGPAPARLPGDHCSKMATSAVNAPLLDG